MFATVSNQTKSVSKTQRDINENDEKESEKVVHVHEEQMRESGRGEGWWGGGREGTGMGTGRCRGRKKKIKLNKQTRKRKESKHTVRVSACHVNALGRHNLVPKFHIVRTLLKDVPVVLVWGYKTRFIVIVVNVFY